MRILTPLTRKKTRAERERVKRERAREFGIVVVVRLHLSVRRIITVLTHLNEKSVEQVPHTAVSIEHLALVVAVAGWQWDSV